MSTYVDNAIYPFRNMIMCHLVADTEQELLEMADKIGVARKWIQKRKEGALDENTLYRKETNRSRDSH